MAHHVRPMTAQDIPDIARWIAQIPLWQRYGLDEHKARRHLQGALQNGDLLLVGDAEEAARCGFAWTMPRGGFGRAYLRLIGVHPAFSGQGLGAALLEATEKALTDQSTALFLLVSDFNNRAQHFYRQHGYQQIGAIPGLVLPNVTELIFWKRFTAHTA